MHLLMLRKITKTVLHLLHLTGTGAVVDTDTLWKYVLQNSHFTIEYNDS